jgi:thiosulfate dehydrogenase [quinone] large subunit
VQCAVQEENLNNLTVERTRDVATAYLLLRTTIGLNIFIHGASRILAGASLFAGSLVPMFQKTILPAWSVYGFGLAVPWVEAILGFLVLVGLRTRSALIGGSTLIFVLTFGSTLRQDWESAGLQLIYAGIDAALLSYRVVLQIIWRKSLHAIWRRLRPCKRWASCPRRVAILLCIDSGCLSHTSNMTDR